MYSPVVTAPVLAGLAPLHLPVLAHLPTSSACVYYNSYSNAILGAANFVTGIEPIDCSGPDCKAVFLPGSLTLARQLGRWNGTGIDLNATLFNNAQAVLIHNAPGYQLDYFPVDSGFTFNETDCATFGQSRGQGLHICVALNGNWTLVAGKYPLPQNLTSIL